MGRVGPVFAVAFDPGATPATGSADGTVWIWDAATGAELARPAHSGPVRAVAWSRQAARWASAA